MHSDFDIHDFSVLFDEEAMAIIERDTEQAMRDIATISHERGLGFEAGAFWQTAALLLCDALPTNSCVELSTSGAQITHPCGDVFCAWPVL